MRELECVTAESVFWPLSPTGLTTAVLFLTQTSTHAHTHTHIHAHTHTHIHTHLPTLSPNVYIPLIFAYNTTYTHSARSERNGTHCYCCTQTPRHQHIPPPPTPQHPNTPTPQPPNTPTVVQSTFRTVLPPECYQSLLSCSAG